MGNLSSLIEDTILVDDEQMYEDLDNGDVEEWDSLWNEVCGEEDDGDNQGLEYDDGLDDGDTDDGDTDDGDTDDGLDDEDDGDMDDDLDDVDDWGTIDDGDTDDEDTDTKLDDGGIDDSILGSRIEVRVDNKNCVEVSSSDDSGVIDVINSLRDRYTNLLRDKSVEIQGLTDDKGRLEQEIIELEAIIADLKGKYNELGSKYNELLNNYKNVTMQYNKLKAESDKLKSISKQAIEDTIEPKVSKVEKTAVNIQDDKSDSKMSKVDYYSSLSMDKLYEKLANYLSEKGVKESAVDKQLLVDEFGASNINKLIVRSYLVPLGSKVTMSFLR